MTVSLLREKFTIREIGLDSTPTIALGNRLLIDLPGHSTPLIIRGHSMHMTLRLGADIMKQLSYLNRVEKVETLFDWEMLWNKKTNQYEKDFTPETWVVIYYKGEPIFQDNYHHAFLDVIEQCEYKNNMMGERYEKSFVMAQKAFQQMGRSVLIEEESHVGFILDADDMNEMRFAVILRMPGHRGTFVVRLSKNAITPEKHDALMIASDFIEAINMAVRAGFLERQLAQQKRGGLGNLKKEHNNVSKRLNSLTVRIQQAEAKFTMKYRPERPDFKVITRTCVEI